MSHWG
jgi:bloom syndrome protein